MSVSLETRYDALYQLLHDRYSCRGFRPDPVPRDTIEQILQAAQRTASSCNTQPWRVHIVSGAARARLARQLLTEVQERPREEGDFRFPSRFVNEYRERRYTCGMQLYDSVGVARDDRSGRLQQMLLNFEFFHAPHVALIFSEADLGDYAAIDCGGYVSNFMNAATALGVGTVPQAAIACYPHIVKPFVGAAEGQLLVCAISFGYPDPEHAANQFRTERAAIADVATFHD